jgi:hypothetical protein
MWHVLVLEGGFTGFGRFVSLPLGDDEGMLKVRQATMVSLFMRKVPEQEQSSGMR